MMRGNLDLMQSSATPVVFQMRIYRIRVWINLSIYPLSVESESLVIPSIQKLVKFSKSQKNLQNYSTMEGVFLNSKVLGDLAKHGFLADLVKEEKINFIALFEIRRGEFPNHF
jgi:hypothetical protein